MFCVNESVPTTRELTACRGAREDRAAHAEGGGGVAGGSRSDAWDDSSIDAKANYRKKRISPGV